VEAITFVQHLKCTTSAFTGSGIHINSIQLSQKAAGGVSDVLCAPPALPHKQYRPAMVTDFTYSCGGGGGGGSLVVVVVWCDCVCFFFGGNAAFLRYRLLRHCFV
jgi:hypothetical protein